MGSKELLQRRVEVHPERFLPWRRAPGLDDASLFWIPVSAFPPRAAEKAWLIQFLARLAAHIENRFELAGEHFLQIKVIYPNLSEPFIRNVQKLLPYQGLARRPGGSVVGPLTQEQIDRFMKSGQVPPLDEMMPDLCFWFITPDAAEIYREFLGSSGYTQIWMAPNPLIPPGPAPINKKVREHPAFKDMDIDGTIRANYAMAHPFQAASRKVFGADLESRTELSGLPFIIPLLHSADVFASSAEARRQWLDLMPIYLNESREDSGIILFGERGLDTPLAEVIAELRAAGNHYPVA